MLKLKALQTALKDNFQTLVFIKSLQSFPQKALPCIPPKLLIFIFLLSSLHFQGEKTQPDRNEIFQFLLQHNILSAASGIYSTVTAFC